MSTPNYDSFLRTRAKQFEYIKSLGKKQIITEHTSLANRGGFYCEVCDVLLKDSRTYIVHTNGRSHQKKLNKSMYVRRVPHTEVKERLQSIQVEHLQQNPQLIQYDDDDHNTGIYLSVLYQLLQTQHDIDESNQNDIYIERDVNYHDDDTTPTTTNNTNDNNDNININSSKRQKPNDDGDNNTNNDTNTNQQQHNQHNEHIQPKFQNYDMWYEVDRYLGYGVRSNVIIPTNTYLSTTEQQNSIHYDNELSNDINDGPTAEEIEAAMIDFDDFDPWADNSALYAASLSKPKKESTHHNNNNNFINNNNINKNSEHEDDTFIGPIPSNEMIYFNHHNDLNHNNNNNDNNKGDIYEEDDDSNWEDVEVTYTTNETNQQLPLHEQHKQFQPQQHQQQQSQQPLPIQYREIVFEEDDGQDWSEDETDLLYQETK